MGRVSTRSNSSRVLRWTQVVLAVAAVATLGLGIARHFLSAQQPGVSVSVSGSHSVGVGVMRGGQINLSAPGQPGRAVDASPISR